MNDRRWGMVSITNILNPTGLSFRIYFLGESNCTGILFLLSVLRFCSVKIRLTSEEVQSTKRENNPPDFS